jgi:hypothetical protein
VRHPKNQREILVHLRLVNSFLTGTHVAGVGSEAVEAQIYLNELARRDHEKQTEIIAKYTKWMTFMTAIILVLTVILVVRDFLIRAP